MATQSNIGNPCASKKEKRITIPRTKKTRIKPIREIEIQRGTNESL
jgi:hypothetical protein